MDRNKIGTQTCYIHQCTNKGMLMYIACLLHVCVPILSLSIFMQSLYYTSNFLNFYLLVYIHFIHYCFSISHIQYIVSQLNNSVIFETVPDGATTLHFAACKNVNFPIIISKG